MYITPLNAVFESARRYAEQLSWKLIPVYGLTLDGACHCGQGLKCTSPGKHPTEKGWQNRASSDPNVIRDWFEGRDDLNLGVRLGPASNLVDLEFDDEAGRATAERYLSGVSTPRLKSSRSVHHLFKWHSSLAAANLKAVAKLNGLECRLGTSAKGAQTVLAPSAHHSGIAYTWLKSPFDVPLADIPEELLALLTCPEDRESRSNEKPVHENVESALNSLNQSRCNDYQDWLKVGMALHSWDSGAAGLSLWDRWSSGSKKYPGVDLLREKWKSFQANGGTNIGSLFHWAGEDGWNPQAIEYSQRVASSDPLTGEKSQAPWKLVRVTSEPPQYKLYGPPFEHKRKSWQRGRWPGFLLIDDCKAINRPRRICDMALERLGVYLDPDKFIPEWVGGKKDSGMVGRLLAEDHSEAPDSPESVRLFVVADLVQQQIRLAQADDEPHEQGQFTKVEDEYWCRHNAILRRLNCDGEKVLSSELAQLWEDIDAAVIRRRVGNCSSQIRFRVLGEEAQRKLQEMATHGAADFEPTDDRRSREAGDEDEELAGSMCET
jgi:bifunctional DNA primase/polymerase-like protein/primase-like protein